MRQMEDDGMPVDAVTVLTRLERSGQCEYCFAPATVTSRWKTPLCERCWQIASRGQGFDPRSDQPRPFGPIPGDDELEEAAAGD